MSGPTSWWLGDDVVVLRGESARRAYAAMALAIREHRRNGVPLTSEMVADLGVLRRAAERARTGIEVPLGSVGSLRGVPSVDAAVMDTSQICAALDCSPEYARRLCRQRFRTAHRVGREWRASAAEVQAYAETRGTERSA